VTQKSVLPKETAESKKKIKKRKLEGPGGI
jgi:hypothetical protein